MLRRPISSRGSFFSSCQVLVWETQLILGKPTDTQDPRGHFPESGDGEKPRVIRYGGKVILQAQYHREASRSLNNQQPKLICGTQKQQPRLCPQAGTSKTPVYVLRIVGPNT